MGGGECCDPCVSKGAVMLQWRAEGSDPGSDRCVQLRPKIIQVLSVAIRRSDSFVSELEDNCHNCTVLPFSGTMLCEPQHWGGVVQQCFCNIFLR